MMMCACWFGCYWKDDGVAEVLKKTFGLNVRKDDGVTGLHIIKKHYHGFVPLLIYIIYLEYAFLIIW